LARYQDCRTFVDSNDRSNDRVVGVNAIVDSNFAEQFFEWRTIQWECT
jgi:hypothetical protein